VRSLGGCGAEPTRHLDVSAGGAITVTSYGALREASNRFANLLGRHGIARGDRVAILLPQSVEVAIAHVAAYKAGAVALPLAALFGVDALGFRLKDAGAKVLITNGAGLVKLAAIGADLPELSLCFPPTGRMEARIGFAQALAGQSSDFQPVETGPDDPAMMIYTSGTTGPPKARCMATGCCSAICRACRCPTSFSRSEATGCGPPPTGPGRAAC
jgi:acetyl-CoA synthetase